MKQQCSFCGKERKDVQALVVSRNGSAAICNGCVAVATSKLLTNLKAAVHGGVAVADVQPLVRGDGEGN